MYDLYIDYDCVAQFYDWNEAKKAYDNAVQEFPDSVIDILSSDGEISYCGVN